MKTIAPLVILITFFLFAFQTNQQAPQNGVDNADNVLDSLESTGTIADTAVVDGYLKDVMSLLDQGQYEKAVSLAREAERISTKHLGQKNLKSALAFHQIGVCMEKLSKLDSVEFYYNKALEIKLALLGEDHPEVADVYHDFGVYYTSRGAFSDASLSLNRALEIRSKGDVDSLKLSNIFNDLGLMYVTQKKYPEASEYLNKSLEIRLQLLGEQDALVGQSFNNVASIYYYRGLYNKSVEYLKKGLDIKAESLGDNNPQLIGTYMNIGAILSLQGEFSTSNQYFQKALNIIQNHFGKNHNLAIKLNANIGSLYFEQEDYEKALEYYRKSMDGVITQNGNDHPDLIDLYKGAGTCYRGLKKYEKALNYFNKAVAVSNSNFGKDNIAIGNTYHGMALVLEKLGREKEAESLYHKIIEINKSNFGDQHPLLGTYYHSLANYYTDTGNLEKASKINRLAQKSLNFDKSNEGFEDVLNLRYLSLVLDSEAKINEEKYYETDSLKYLIEAAHSNQKSIQVLNELKRRYIEPSNRKDLISSRYVIFERGISIYHEMNETPSGLPDHWDAFRLMEQSKSLALKDAFYKVGAKTYFDIPEAFVEKEHDLKYKIAQLEKDRYEQSSGINEKKEKDSIYAYYTSQIFDFEKSLDSLRQLFQSDYPGYFQVNYDTTTLGIDELRKNILTESQSLLNYFTGDSSIFIFAITKDTFTLRKIKKDFPLKEWVKQMREGIYRPFIDTRLDQMTRDSLATLYTEAAWNLYEKLFLPVKHVIADKTELIIVPDGVLGYIPFDALLTSPVEAEGNYRDYPYLLKDYQASIAYSSTLLKEMRDKKHLKKPSRDFLAVAPSFGPAGSDTLLLASRYIDVADDRNRLGALQYNIPEALALQELVGGDALTDSLATENTFLEKASDYRVLHLSTHGKANDKVGDYSFLAFYEQDDSLENEWLYNRELYEMNLNADMVVLSACETGIGELQRGEGIISLARGFSYAGAKSIITSLWSVNDQQTPELMKSFYTNLKNGQSKDAALRQAKLDFLNNSPNPEPYFWAAFIPIGDMAPVEFSSGFPLWGWGILGLVALAIFGWLIRRK